MQVPSVSDSSNFSTFNLPKRASKQHLSIRNAFIDLGKAHHVNPEEERAREKRLGKLKHINKEATETTEFNSFSLLFSVQEELKKISHLTWLLASQATTAQDWQIVCKNLIKYNLNINYSHEIAKGETILWYAIIGADQNVISFILENQPLADVNQIPDGQLDSPFSYLIGNRPIYIEVLDILLKMHPEANANMMVGSKRRMPILVKLGENGLWEQIKKIVINFSSEYPLQELKGLSEVLMLAAKAGQWTAVGLILHKYPTTEMPKILKKGNPKTLLWRAAYHLQTKKSIGRRALISWIISEILTRFPHDTNVSAREKGKKAVTALWLLSKSHSLDLFFLALKNDKNANLNYVPIGETTMLYNLVSHCTSQNVEIITKFICHAYSLPNMGLSQRDLASLVNFSFSDHLSLEQYFGILSSLYLNGVNVKAFFTKSIPEDVTIQLDKWERVLFDLGKRVEMSAYLTKELLIARTKKVIEDTIPELKMLSEEMFSISVTNYCTTLMLELNHQACVEIASKGYRLFRVNNGEFIKSKAELKDTERAIKEILEVQTNNREILLSIPFQKQIITQIGQDQKSNNPRLKLSLINDAFENTLDHCKGLALNEHPNSNEQHFDN